MFAVCLTVIFVQYLKSTRFYAEYLKYNFSNVFLGCNTQISIGKALGNVTIFNLFPTLKYFPLKGSRFALEKRAPL